MVCNPVRHSTVTAVLSPRDSVAERQCASDMRLTMLRQATSPLFISQAGTVRNHAFTLPWMVWVSSYGAASEIFLS